MKPLTPHYCDLRSFPYIPLDVKRLRDSDLAALESPECCWTAVLLWCASWHQVPAASLPNDDRILAGLAGFGRVVKEWLKVKEGALHGWILCDDGRLYHPVIAEKALTSLESKYRKSFKTEIARIKKHNQRHPEHPLEIISYESFVSHKTAQSCPIGQEIVVPDLSSGKQHPTEQNRTEHNKTDSNLVSDFHVSMNNDQTPSTLKGEICKSLTKIGLAPFNPDNPKFIALIEAGETVDGFVNTANEIKFKDKTKFNFNYLIATLTNRRKDAVNLKLHQGAMPAKSTTQAGRNAAARAIYNQGSSEKLIVEDEEDREEKSITA
jgi:hypothetical protein